MTDERPKGNRLTRELGSLMSPGPRHLSRRQSDQQNAPWILDTPDREDGRRGQDSPAWVDVPIDKGSAETNQAAVLVSDAAMQQSTLHSEADSCAAGGGKALEFSDDDCSDSDCGDEEFTWSENDDATATWISRLMTLQEDARLKKERLESESNRMIQETHHVWVPPFSNGHLFIALPKTREHSEALFRVSYNFEFLSVSKTSARSNGHLGTMILEIRCLGLCRLLLRAACLGSSVSRST